MSFDLDRTVELDIGFEERFHANGFLHINDSEIIFCLIGQACVCHNSRRV
jgi:hypothetical protein